eukprot:9433592-Prorocentrum_lima.AAC.1
MLTIGFGWCHKSLPLPRSRNFSTWRPCWSRIIKARGGGQLLWGTDAMYWMKARPGGVGFVACEGGVYGSVRSCRHCRVRGTSPYGD